MPERRSPGSDEVPGMPFPSTEEAFFEGAQSERHSLSGENRGPRKAEFEIARRLERKALAVNQRLRVNGMRKAAGDAPDSVDKLMPFQLPEKKLQPQRSQPA